MYSRQSGCFLASSTLNVMRRVAVECRGLHAADVHCSTVTLSLRSHDEIRDGVT